MTCYWATLKKVLSGMLARPVWAMMILALCLMSLVYARGTVWDLPVAVINQDNSPASQKLIRTLDASPKMHLISYDSMSEAMHDLGWRRLFAIIIIPVDFEKKMLAGKPVAIPVYGDATNRLPNGEIQQNVVAAYQQMLSRYEISLLMKNDFTEQQARVVLQPMLGTTQPLFNPGISFAAIIFPGLLAMLLQHSLMIASVRVNLVISADGRPPLSVVLGALSALIPIWLFLSLVLFVLWPWVLGYRQLATISDILLLTFPFLLATMGIGRLLTACINRTETIYLTLSFMTMPVFYISGTIWPLQAMPETVRFISSMLPSTWAIKAIAGINQMGLPLKETLPDIARMLLLGIFYIAVSLVVDFFSNRGKALRSSGMDR